MQIQSLLSDAQGAGGAEGGHESQIGQSRASLHLCAESRQALFYEQHPLCREREEQRAVMRAREAEAEGRLRALHAHVLEFRSKARPVEEYAASDKAEQLQRARQALEAARSRMEQYEAQAQVL